MANYCRAGIKSLRGTGRNKNGCSGFTVSDKTNFTKIDENNATFRHFLAYHFIISLICTETIIIYREKLYKT
jgi:hypothetical protein